MASEGSSGGSLPGKRQGRLSVWWHKLFPSMPDFYGLLNRQCELVVEASGQLLAYMHSGDDTSADRVVELEHLGQQLRAENMTVLHRAFATPFDREDIYRSIAALNDILNYTKTTVREMRGLGLGPDEHTLAMAELLHEGAQALQRGFAHLQLAPLRAEADAEVACRTERATERVYRKALSELFNAGHYQANLTEEQQQAADSLEVLMQTLTQRELAAVGSVVGFVVEILKRREVYRHMSNAADRVERAGDVLHDIVAKVA
ncbi:DUF47 domain-containing protein [Pseudomaricurvus sp. HS19]|uniref:DUF47 domain-containing protein n=1 Tax=Pseudomaricurvus sp. HS19 TaxID=2692626 RepID=UPI00136DB9B8|nr:DUF47 family protein [Pseudomaricurvus sp. HS19]MYM62154.1 DUF47 family protein [Pseudomaricurvus sp. HS19]